MTYIPFRLALCRRFVRSSRVTETIPARAGSKAPRITSPVSTAALDRKADHPRVRRRMHPDQWRGRSASARERPGYHARRAVGLFGFAWEALLSHLFVRLTSGVSRARPRASAARRR